MKRVVLGIVVAALLAVPGRATAASIELAELAFFVDGTEVNTAIDGTPLSAELSDLDDAFFNYGTGLGTITLTITGTGPHTVIGFYDLDIYDLVSGPNLYSDDSGEALGTPPAGAGWEIDEPGWNFGDIYDNFGSGGPLDATVFDGVITKEDVAMAMSWDFVLGAGDTAFVTFVTSQTDPGSGFRLRQFDASGDEVFLFASLEVAKAPVPEPTVLALFGVVAAGAVRGVRRSATKAV